MHRIFGASNVAKLLQELPAQNREDAVNSLSYEADARVNDPIYGCVGALFSLQQQVARLQAELAIAQAELVRLHATAVTQSPAVPTLGGAVEVVRYDVSAGTTSQAQAHGGPPAAPGSYYAGGGYSFGHTIDTPGGGGGEGASTDNSNPMVKSGHGEVDRKPGCGSEDVSGQSSLDSGK